MGSLSIENLRVAYNNSTVVSDFSLDIFDGEMVSLLGPSGAGKTTILKVIAGLLPAASGNIRIDGKCVNHVSADKRDTVLIFQKPLLFPHLDVVGNIGFGLRMSNAPVTEARDKITNILQLTGLSGLEKRKTHQLSGGQQQRVALARGLILEPSILLLDEPLSNLDAGLRTQMRELICEVQEKTGTTMLFVTHDQGEALTISDRICLLGQGRARQIGTPEELFYSPVDRYTASFFGSDNFLEGTIVNNTFQSDFGRCHTQKADRAKATAAIRPEHIQVYKEEREGGLPAKVQSVQFEGTTIRLLVSAMGQELSIITMERGYTEKQKVWLHFPEDRIHVFES